MRWLGKWLGNRRRARGAASRNFIPRLEPLERREVLSLTYGGAPLPHVEVQALYYGSLWSTDSGLSAQAGRFEAYLQYLVNSPYMDMLQSAGYGVGRGTWSRGVIALADLPAGSTLPDASIRSTIQSYIRSGSLQDADAERLYVVFVQPDVVVTSGEGSSRNEPHGFVGYHNSFAGTDAFGYAAQVRYAVVVTLGGGYNGYSSTLPAFDQMTPIASHELAEAVTDPDPFSGWVDYGRGQELGDVYANNDVYLNHYVVQMEADTNDNPIVPRTETFVAGEFPGAGVWRYSSVFGWRQLTPADASTIDADANGDVVAEIRGFGVWRFEDATGWRQLTPADASRVGVDSRGDVVAEIAGFGVWRYEDGTGWQQLTPADASLIGIADGVVAVEIPNAGVWRFEDANGWTQLTTADASTLDA
jgi:hypothetical protein